MIERITTQLINESGDTIEVSESDRKKEIQIEVIVADAFSTVCLSNNKIKDDEIRVAEKFRFALSLIEYLEDINRNAD